MTSMVEYKRFLKYISKELLWKIQKKDAAVSVTERMAED